jgi:hypothetical protein
MYQPARPEVVSDRLAALRSGGVATIERLLRRVPSLADALVGRGHLVDPYLRSSAKTVDSISRFATLISSQAVIPLIIAHAGMTETKLLSVTAWNGGLVSKEQASAETGADPDVLERAVTGLAELLLIDRSAGWSALRPGVLEHVALPARPFRRYADLYTSAELEIIASNLDVVAGTRKWERVDAVERALRDPDTVGRLLDHIDRDSLSFFLEVAQAPGAIRASDPYRAMTAYMSEHERIRMLSSIGLMGRDRHTGDLWVWLDVLVAMRGGLFDDYDEFVPQLSTIADDHRVASMPGVVSTLDRLLAQYAASPVAALKSGGIGVQAIRATAKALRLDTVTVGLLTVLAVDLGLLGAVINEERGRGRNRTIEYEWRLTTAVTEWKAQPAARRWQRLVAAWLDSRQLPVDGKPVERYEFSPWSGTALVPRGVFARALAELDGVSLHRGEFATWMVHRHPTLHDVETTAQLLAEAEVLGLVEGSDRVTLTAAARLLFGGGQVEEVLSGGPVTFVVQADHSLIAPPDLAADVAATLERFAHLESDAGARIYRIDERGVASAIDGGTEADEILAFLARHAPTGVPSNVERTVTDVADRHGKLQVGSGATWIASDDPALISRAVGVKAAKLTAISPTSAVSSLPRTKVMTALRAAGLPALDTEAERAAPTSQVPRGFAVDHTERIELFPRDLVALAAGLSDITELTYEVDWDSELDRLTEDL